MRVTTAAVAVILALTMTPVQGAAPACRGAAYRQFDFWLGRWTARDREKGTYLGTDEVTLSLQNCMLEEKWHSSANTHGESFNAYDAASGRWRQTWIDDGGHVLLFEGGLRNGVMVLTGTTRDLRGRTQWARLSYAPSAKGTLTVTYDTAGESHEWKRQFDGIYARRK